jgi:hypothetical protein
MPKHMFDPAGALQTGRLVLSLITSKKLILLSCESIIVG